MKRLSRSLAVVLAAAAVAGCEDDPAGPTVASGTISATYAGYIDGTFSPSGAYENRPTTTYAVAFDIPDTPNGALHIGGEQYEDGTGRTLVMTLNGAAPGTYSLDEDCDYDAAQCAYGRFLIDEDLLDNKEAHPYAFIGGSVVIAETSGGRMSGTFSGEVQRYNPDTGALIPDRFVTFSGGNFNVPVVPLATN